MGISKRPWENILIGIIITALSAATFWLSTDQFKKYAPSFLKHPPQEMLEAKFLDYRFKMRGPIKPPDSIVIAAIDEKSIAALGRWPWRRDTIAMLVDRLAAAGAELVLFDIILAEREDNDEILAKSMRDAGTVMLPLVFDLPDDTGRQAARKTSGHGGSMLLSQSAYQSVNDAALFKDDPPPLATGVLAPVETLSREAMGLGHINMLADYDGTLRWESLVIWQDELLFPAIGLRAAAYFLGVPWEKVTVVSGKGIQLGTKRFIPTNRVGQTLINYYGPTRTFPHFPISDIMDGAVPAEALGGKIVLIGATDARGVFDLRVTPFTAEMPGIEKHASVIASILDNRMLRKVPERIDLVILIAIGIMFSVAVCRFKAWGALGLTLLFSGLMALAGYLLFSRQGLWVNVSYPVSTVLVIFIGVTAYNYAVEEQFARKIRAMFSSYATERLVDEFIRNPDMAKLGGERRELTILFSDVRGFTTFSERHSPEEVVAILNEYLGAMTEVVFQWEGHLDKFIGDAVMAFWGAPMPQEHHAELAIKCGLAMIARLEQLREKWKSEGKDGLDIGIGINTGEVIVGNIGAEGQKMDYTVIGDHVNLCSRIESLTRKYGAKILITEFTLAKIRDAVAANAIGHLHVKGLEKVIVKGKAEPVGIYEIVSMEHGDRSVITECDPEKITKLYEK